MARASSLFRPEARSPTPEARASEFSASAPRAYVGRFAPSPTGSLHLGSLLAAVASYLDARHCGGRWLLRMEDLDTARVISGSADEILRTLERFALFWDGEIVWQSARSGAYVEALERLTAAARTFECSCSRRELADQDIEGYPGTCRDGPKHAGPTATRFRVDESRSVTLHDRIQGEYRARLADLGDVVIRRRDGRFAYQLAVVVDDAWQGVTDVVRGADLLPSTPWQIELHRALGLPEPRYAHVPVLVEPDGRKLAKSRRSVALAAVEPGRQLSAILRWLGLELPDELAGSPPSALLEWAVPRWRPRTVPPRPSLPVSG